VILFVRSFALEDDIARDSVVDSEPELALVEAVLLRPEIYMDSLWQIHALLIRLGNRRYVEPFWHLS
jgi:hypothetical protein